VNHNVGSIRRISKSVNIEKIAPTALTTQRPDNLLALLATHETDNGMIVRSKLLNESAFKNSSRSRDKYLHLV
jgi:hypothetical protein